MAKIAVELHRALRERALHGAAGAATARELARGDGWRAADVICTSGPDDRPFEEQHPGVSIAIVISGTFQYRTGVSPELMSPGSFLLGTPKQSYECAHDHAAGDHCISFQFDRDAFESLTGTRLRFGMSRLPPLRASASIVARACAALSNGDSWEELAVLAAAHAVQLASDRDLDTTASPHGIARVTRAIRAMEQNSIPLPRLARDAGLSPYHFLRTFTRLAGVTPHQFALRTRLRDAALRLAWTDARIIDVALDSGFGDVSNFNRTFRAEFGVTPREYRASAANAPRTPRPSPDRRSSRRPSRRAVR